ncbi:MAG: hypothetical protein ABSB74_15475 [Tepidisphaeraceae bacterium]
MAYKQLPDSFGGGLLEGFENYLLGESDGGVGRLREDLKIAADNVGSTWTNVEQIGAKYGAAL